MASLQSILKAAKVVEQAATEARPLEEAVKAMNARPPKDVPPLERAPAKSKKELEETAQRVAPQITGEFVKGKTSSNILGMSKKRFEREKELEHDIRQTEKPSELKMFDYPSNVGKVQVGVFGDPTISGKAIKGVAGKPLARESEQFGGPHYNLYHPEDAWASDWGAAAGLQNLAYDASHQYGGVPVVGMYTKMGPAAYGHAQHLSDAIMMNIVSELPNMSKKQIDAFNTLVRNNPKAKDFAGIENPEISLAQMTENSEMRKQFYGLAIQPTLTERLNMPNGLDVVHAALDPDLRYLETGITGHSVVELDPTIRSLKSATHPTYDTRIPRKSDTDVMQTEVPIPYELQYPDQLLSISKNPRQAPQPFGTLQMSGARQIIDPQLIDELGTYRDFIKKYTGKAKGGEVDLEEEYKKANILEKKPEQGGAKIMERPNPYGLRAFETDTGYGGEMMPKTSGWAGEIPSLAKEGQVLTEVSLGGENGEPFYPMVFEGITPEQIEIVQDYEAGLREDNDPAVMAVKQLAKNKALTRMHMRQSPFKDVKMAGGGKVGALEKIIKTVSEVSKETKLPPPENAARTQVANTKGTYDKARELLKLQGVDKNIIDYGAGKGIGSYGWADTYEPYAKGWYPTYTKAEDIPSDMYSGLLNLNVLNVLPPELRAEAIENMGRVLEKGGKGVVTTRGKDVMSGLAGGRPGPEPMSVITSWDTYQKGFTGQELEDELRRILGTKFDVNKLNLGPAGAKIQKKAEGGVMDSAASQLASTWEGYSKSANLLKELATKYYEGLGEDVSNLDWNAIRDIPSNIGADLLGLPGDLAKFAFPYGTGVYAKGIEDQPSKFGSERIKEGMQNIGIASGKDYPFIEGTAEVFPGTTLKAVKSIPTLGKALAKEGARQIQTGEGLIGRNVINPRQNIIKDPGGMLVGGEKDLEGELRHMRKPETAVDINADGNFITKHDPSAVALNNWIDTKVKKYIRNQAGSEADPILKAVDSGVGYNFTPERGDTKYAVATKREQVGKPKEGIAKTDLGKEWEYKVDSIFNPTKSQDIKDILQRNEGLPPGNAAEKFKASLLRMEHDLPVYNKEDVEAIKLINQIPDENVYSLSGTNITERLGLNHVADVLHEDLVAGRLTPEQMNQMSIEKAIRRTAEYDVEKAKEMAKASAKSIEGMPVPKEYDDGFKWVELKHGTDSDKTKAALKSEGDIMGHCVGGPGYCSKVLGGNTQIFSLRGPDNKSHVTIEVSKKSHLNSWLKANEEEINKDPLIKQMHYPNPDERYRGQYTEEELDEIYKDDITKMLKMKGAPVYESPDAWIDIVQVKGKENRRPNDKYQKYVTDFVKSNVAKHEITDIHELENTNLMDVQSLIAEGLVPKSVHFHPEIIKALESTVPNYQKQTPLLKDEYTYGLIKGIAKDFASKGQYYIDDEDIINAARSMYKNKPGHKSGGSVTKYDLEKEFKLNNIIEIPRRKHG